MRKSLSILLGLLAVFAFAGVAFAAEGGASAGGTDPVSGMVLLAIAAGMTVVAVGCGIAQCIGLKTACEGTARNPEASGKIMVTLILGLAFIESMAIYALVVNLIILFMKL